VIEVDLLLVFVATTFMLVLSPGPAVIAVVTEAAANGFKRSLWIILGIALANVVFFILSATGIAALIIASSTLFSIIKWVGVAYLFHLGFQALFRKTGPPNFSDTNHYQHRAHKTFLRGFSLELANPKALLYFSALLPQFISLAKPVLPQLAIFCVITFLLDLFCYSMYAYLGGKAIIFSKKPLIIKTINRVAGGMLIFTGFRMAVVER